MHSPRSVSTDGARWCSNLHTMTHPCVNLLTSWEEMCTFRGPARHWIATSKRPNLPRYERNSSHEVSKCTCKLTKKSLFCSRLEKKLFAWLLSLLSSKTECDSRHSFIPLPLRGRTRQVGTAEREDWS